MSAHITLAADVSPAAETFRRRWFERWAGFDPVDCDGAPVGTHSGHGDAYPEFRNPLSEADSMAASAVFHAGAVKKLARGTLVALLTFDFEVVGTDQHSRERSDLQDVLSREHVWSLTETDDDEGTEVRTHVFFTSIALDDPRLGAVFEMTAEGSPVLVADADLSWVARPLEEWVDLVAVDAGDLALLAAAEAESRARRRIPRLRSPHVDLAAVAAHVTSRRRHWSSGGVRITAGPQYRVWDGDHQPTVTETQPADLDRTDWLLVELASASASAMFVAHDGGACTIRFASDESDGGTALPPDRPRGSAGSLDFAGMLAALEQTVTALAHHASHRG